MFFKKKRLSDGEIAAIIDKIQLQYSENAVIYGQQYFNMQKFYDKGTSNNQKDGIDTMKGVPYVRRPIEDSLWRDKSGEHTIPFVQFLRERRLVIISDEAHHYQQKKTKEAMEVVKNKLKEAFDFNKSVGEFKNELMEKETVLDKKEKALNKKSGVLGISGKYTDRRDIQKAAAEGEDRKSTRLNSSHTDISRMPSSA